MSGDASAGSTKPVSVDASAGSTKPVSIDASAGSTEPVSERRIRVIEIGGPAAPFNAKRVQRCFGTLLRSLSG
ncbi:hypothetical protein [Halorubrum sp. SP9]|uniref:hypothetical protein n=1 Tax=Halorubrum sp. SP9 TaxID=1537267 RepID=UPI0010F99E9A|nr:hypothetical protein [Halorubrum sp. SP9]TKX68765.1 hypothetical protein EXE45_10760 [Halorubrum sp. SP9]